MWTDQAIMNLSSNKTYTRSELTKIFQDANPGLTESAFRWTLYNLQKIQKIFRKDYDEYGRFCIMGGVSWKISCNHCIRSDSYVLES